MLMFFVNSNLLQVMVFSKNQSEKEIDEMHSNYSKWFYFQDTLTINLLTPSASDSPSWRPTKVTDETVLHNLTTSVKSCIWIQCQDCTSAFVVKKQLYEKQISHFLPLLNFLEKYISAIQYHIAFAMCTKTTKFYTPRGVKRINN